MQCLLLFIPFDSQTHKNMIHLYCLFPVIKCHIMSVLPKTMLLYQLERKSPIMIKLAKPACLLACFYDLNFLKVNFPISPQNSWCHHIRFLFSFSSENSPPGFKTAVLVLSQSSMQLGPEAEVDPVLKTFVQNSMRGE